MMLCRSAQTLLLMRSSDRSSDRLDVCVKHSVLAAQVSLWLLYRRRTGERESGEAAVASLAGDASGAPSSAGQRVTGEASTTVAASTAGACVKMTILPMMSESQRFECGASCTSLLI